MALQKILKLELKMEKSSISRVDIFGRRRYICELYRLILAATLPQILS